MKKYAWLVVGTIFFISISSFILVKDLSKSQYSVIKNYESNKPSRSIASVNLEEPLLTGRLDIIVEMSHGKHPTASTSHNHKTRRVSNGVVKYIYSIQSERERVFIEPTDTKMINKDLTSGMRVSLLESRNASSQSLNFKLKDNPNKNLSNLRLGVSYTLRIEAGTHHQVAAKSATTNEKVLVVRMSTPWNPQGEDPAYTHEATFNTNSPTSFASLLNRITYNTLTLSGKVIGLAPNGGCLVPSHLYGMSASAIDYVEENASSLNVNLSDYQRLILAIPGGGPCGNTYYGTIGKAQMPFKNGMRELSISWMYIRQDGTSEVPSSYAALLQHEFGHNLGLQHSSSVRCSGDLISHPESCIIDEYGDNIDVMGSGHSYLKGAYMSPKLDELNILSLSNITQVTTTGVYDIYNLHSNLNSVQPMALRIPVKVVPAVMGGYTPTYLSLDYWASPETLSLKGVYIRLWNEHGYSYWLKRSDNQNPNLKNTGDVFFDASMGYRITLLAIDDIKVRVRFEVLSPSFTAPVRVTAQGPAAQFGVTGSKCTDYVVEVTENYSGGIGEFIVANAVEDEAASQNMEFVNGERLSSAPSGKARFLFRWPWLNASRTHTVSVSTSGYYVKTKIPIRQCSDPTPQLDLTNVRPNPSNCYQYQVGGHVSNWLSGAEVSVFSYQYGTAGEICNTNLNINGNFQCIFNNLNPNLTMRLIVTVPGTNLYKDMPQDRWTCAGATPKPNILPLGFHKVGYPDPCHNYLNIINTKNIPDGESIKITAYGPSSYAPVNEVNATVVGNRTEALISGLNPQTQYYFEAQYKDMSAWLAWHTPNCNY